MAKLDKRDLEAAFFIFALIYLLDAAATGFLGIGIVVFILLIGTIWLSEHKKFKHMARKRKKGTIDWILRLGFAISLMGIFMASFYVLALGLFIAESLLFIAFDNVEIDLWTMAIEKEKQ